MNEEEIINVLGNLFFDEYEWFLRGYDEQTKEQDLEMVEKAIQGLLDLYNKEKEKNKQLEKIIRIIRNKLKYKVIIEEDGIYKPCKNLSKQEVYKDYEEIIELLKADYCFMDNETAIKEILKENGVN